MKLMSKGGRNKNYFSKLYRYIHRKLLRPRSSVKRSIKGNNNSIKIHGSALLIQCEFEISGNNNTIIIEGPSYFKDVTFYICGDNNNINISEKVRFNRGGSLWVEDERCEIRIGAKSTFEDAHLAVTEPGSSIIIGKDCMFAYDIDVRTGDSHSIINATTMKRTNYAQNIEVGDHVWIASHVSILKGVKIRENSVVATRSVVTRKFDKRGILIGGIPAKEINENITWSRERIYEDN